MNLFTKLHGRRVPPGLEWQILRRLPYISLAGSLIPVALAAKITGLPRNRLYDYGLELKNR